MIGDDPCDRGLVDEQGRLVTDNEKQQGHRPDDERSGRPLAILVGVEVFHNIQRLFFHLGFPPFLFGWRPGDDYYYLTLGLMFLVPGGHFRKRSAFVFLVDL